MFSYFVQHPRLVLALAAAAAAMLVPGVSRLELRTDGRALVPTDDPAILHDAHIRERFGVKDQIAVTITAEGRSSIYNGDTMRLVRELSTAFAEIDAIDSHDILSLATVHRDRVWPGTMRFRTFLEPFPESPADFDLVRSDIDAVGLIRGTLVSYDEQTTAIVIGVDPDDDRTAVVYAIAAVLEKQPASEHTLRVVGAPVAESQLGLHILADLTILIPLVVAVIAVVLYLLTRTIWAVVLGACEVSATMIATFGTMGYLGVPVYLTTAILPVTLTAIATADEIHIFGRYMQLLRRQGDAPVNLIVETMRDIAPAVILTSITTAVAFLSFASSPIGAIRVFGVFQCLGVLVAMLWSLAVTPAALACLDGRAFKKSAARDDPMVPWLARLAAWSVRRRRLVLASTLAVLAVGLLATARLDVQDSWIDGFSTDSKFFQDTAFVDTNFHGTHVLQISLEASEGLKPLFEPAVLDTIGELESLIATLPGVGGVLGPRSQLEVMNYLLLARRADARSIPRDRAKVSTVLRYMEGVRGRHRVREIFDENGHGALITAFLSGANFVDTARIMAAMEDFATRELTPRGIETGYAGDIAVSQAMIPAIVRSQILSLLLTLGSILLVASLFSGSFAQGVCCTLPALAAGLLVFAAMGLASIPLGVATSMFCAITLGVGVDYAVHITMRYRKLVSAGTLCEAAIAGAITTTGRTITIDAACVAAGFGVLLVSDVPANARLGTLVATSVAFCFAATLVVLPALLALWKPSFGVVAAWPTDRG